MEVCREIQWREKTWSRKIHLYWWRMVWWKLESRTKLDRNNIRQRRKHLIRKGEWRNTIQTITPPKTTNRNPSETVKHLLIIFSILLLSSPLFGQSSKKIDLSLLAKELMSWMMVNCNVPGVHPEHNFCNLNWNHPVPEIKILPRKQLVK